MTKFKFDEFQIKYYQIHYKTNIIINQLPLLSLLYGQMLGLPHPIETDSYLWEHRTGWEINRALRALSMNRLRARASPPSTQKRGGKRQGEEASRHLTQALRAINWEREESRAVLAYWLRALQAINRCVAVLAASPQSTDLSLSSTSHRQVS